MLCYVLVYSSTFVGGSKKKVREYACEKLFLSGTKSSKKTENIPIKNHSLDAQAYQQLFESLKD